jgi:lipopolysaccharide/colanic/teichoic acid biosynthesis glycosyltransferase
MYRFCKRAFDIFFASLGLMLFSPLMIFVALLIRLDSPGPVFYRGIRVGLKGKKFKIFKFRTMVENAEKIGGPSTALNDPRLTKIGRFLRKYKLDELPQLINIILGTMSFVGPRPQVEKYTNLYNEEEKTMLSVKPGITDYASIKFINQDQILGDESVDTKYLLAIEPEKNNLRMQYAKEQSFLVDLKILFITFVQILRIRSIRNTKDEVSPI